MWQDLYAALSYPRSYFAGILIHLSFALFGASTTTTVGGGLLLRAYRAVLCWAGAAHRSEGVASASLAALSIQLAGRGSSSDPARFPMK